MREGRRTCEGQCSIDLAYLKRWKLLTPDRRTTLSWSQGGSRSASIAVIAQTDGVRLEYTVPGQDGAKIDVSEFVPFMYTATPFGGQRRWLKCLECSRACRVIYGGRLFRCRLCHDLRYGSQREPNYQRAIDGANKIRKRLGDDTGNAFEHDPFPEKPKGMRWATYRKLEQKYERLQSQWTGAALAKFGPAWMAL